MLRIASAGSRSARPAAAAAEVARGLARALGGARAEAAILFAGDPSAASLERACLEAASALGTTRVVGCGGQGIVAPEGEIERGPGLTGLALAGDFDARAFLVRSLRGRAEEVGREIGRIAAATDREPRAVLLLADSYSLAPDELLAGIAAADPGLAVFGAGASEAGRTGQTRVACCSGSGANAVAGLVLAGLELDCAVSQGCEPVGGWRRVTRAEGHRVLELDGEPAADVYLRSLPGILRADLERALRVTFAGLAEGGGAADADDAHDAQQRRNPRDAPDYFVVRRLIGLERRSGALLVGDEVLSGVRLSILVRSASAARDSLRAGVSGLLARLPGLAGALYFHSVERGAALHGVDDLELCYLREGLGRAELAGVFSGVELAPLGGRNRFHELAGVLVGIAEPRARVGG